MKFSDFDNSYDKMWYLRKLLNETFDYCVDITRLNLYEIDGRNVVFWVAGEVSYLGVWDDYGINLCWNTEKEDSYSFELMESILETAAKYEDLKNG